MRRSPLLAVAAVAAVALVACGDSTVDPLSTPAPSATSPASPAPPTDAPSTDAPAATAPPGGTTYEHATGAEDVVVEVTNEGGFLPVEVAFQQPPLLLVTGDGRAVTTGPVMAIYPGPLLPNLQQRTIAEPAVQQLLGLADSLGLLADVTYARNDQIADASDTVVRLRVGAETYEHRAYALGMDGDEDAARNALAEFVAAATDLAGTVGDDALGPEEPLDADVYLVRALPVDPADYATDVEPTLVDWPAELPPLADATDCVAVPTADAADLFTDATQLTFFVDDDVTYSLGVTPRVPGRTC